MVHYTKWYLASTFMSLSSKHISLVHYHNTIDQTLSVGRSTRATCDQLIGNTSRPPLATVLTADNEMKRFLHLELIVCLDFSEGLVLYH